MLPKGRHFAVKRIQREIDFVFVLACWGKVPLDFHSYIFLLGKCLTDWLTGAEPQADRPVEPVLGRFFYLGCLSEIITRSWAGAT